MTRRVLKIGVGNGAYKDRRHKMANMGYCKWENTASALEQCLAAEDEYENIRDYNEMSASEKAGMVRCLKAALLLLENADRKLLREVDVDLNRLA